MELWCIWTIEIDIWVPELKLAIEYDGEQHYRPVRYGSMSTSDAKKRLKVVKMLDKEKNEKMKEHKDDIHYFVRLGYANEMTEEHIRKVLTESGAL
jgi:hypothetical protein